MSILDLTRDLDRSAITLDMELGGARCRRRRRLERSTALVVERKDIWFESHPDDRDAVSIRICVHNRGAHVSPPAVLHVQSAAFGAFLPWRPLGSVPLPPLAPGAAYTVELQARAGTVGSQGTLAPIPLASGDVAMPPPTRGAPPAQGDGGEEGSTGSGQAMLRYASLDGSRQLRAHIDALIRRAGGSEALANSIERVAGSRGHWAGNIEVWLDGRDPVERHMARGQQAVVGQTNSADFVVGSRRPDAYRFHFSGLYAEWSAALVRDQLLGLAMGASVDEDPTVPIGQWVELDRSTPFIVNFCPPAGSTSGELIVHVEQRSTGREALVEFGFGPEAAGPGCYTA